MGAPGECEWDEHHFTAPIWISLPTEILCLLRWQFLTTEGVCLLSIPSQLLQKRTLVKRGERKLYCFVAGSSVHIAMWLQRPTCLGTSVPCCPAVHTLAHIFATSLAFQGFRSPHAMMYTIIESLGTTVSNKEQRLNGTEQLLPLGLQESWLQSTKLTEGQRSLENGPAYSKTQVVTVVSGFYLLRPSSFGAIPGIGEWSLNVMVFYFYFL